jgi:hypothetical protein
VSSIETSTLPGSASRGHHQLPRAFRNPSHRIDAIHDQIQQNLLQLNSVAQHRSIASGQVGLERNALAAQLAGGERQHFSYDVVDIEPGELRTGLLGERSQTADHVACARAVPHDSGECIPGLVEIGLLPIQPVQTRRAVRRDAGERLVDLVGDRGCHLAQGRQPRGMGKLRLGDSQRLFRALAFGDVDHEPAKEVCAPCKRRQKGASLYPRYAAVFVRAA